MWEAGNPGKKNPTIFSRAWIDYVCGSNRLCVLRISEDADKYEIDRDATEDWFKVNGITYEPQPTESAYIESNGRTIGVETCYDITSANIENCLKDVEIHVNMKTEEGSGLTSSTGKTNGSDGDIALDLTCPSITNPPTNAKTPVPTNTNDGGSGPTNQPTSAPINEPTSEPTQSPTDPPTQPVSYLILIE
jgi:hypothetical protein